MLSDHATPPAQPAGIPAARAKPQRRYRGQKPVNPAPRITLVMMDGRPVARVALGGKRGEGRHMLVDWDVWTTRIVPTYGTAWGINLSGHGSPYVVRSAQCFAEDARRGSKQRGPRPFVRLHRVIAEPARGARVRFRSGNTLDLRQANLEATSEPDRARAI